MLLCDIGNTSFHFLDGEDDFKESAVSFNPASISKKVYYISVNEKVQKSLQNLDNWIDLSNYVSREKYYATMGIDRIMAVEAVANGIIIDAGSAVTVDVVKEGKFEGGFIYPGLKSIEKTYKEISPLLDSKIDFELSMQELPKNTEDAIAYAYLKPLQCEVFSHKLPIILTGGDAESFKNIFPKAKIEVNLIFSSMKKLLKSLAV
jgi:type III pantothenate kinase